MKLFKVAVESEVLVWAKDEGEASRIARRAVESGQEEVLASHVERITEPQQIPQEWRGDCSIYNSARDDDGHPLFITAEDALAKSDSEAA